MSHNLDLEPGLLPTSDLKMILLNKGVKLSNSETKEGLIELFNKYVKPQPQRSRKSKNDAQIICLKTEKISLSEALERREKRFKVTSTDIEMTPVSSQTSPRKIILKRPHINNLGNFEDEIKKKKFN